MKCSTCEGKLALSNADVGFDDGDVCEQCRRVFVYMGMHGGPEPDANGRIWPERKMGYWRDPTGLEHMERSME